MLAKSILSRYSNIQPVQLVLKSWLSINAQPLEINSEARVRIKQGEIQGNLETLSTGNKFASFKGIPYAKPPVGKLRFQAPQPVEPWNGVLDATEHGDICPQFDMFTGKVLEGNENSLFLNVYTPNLSGPPAPVMVWIYGGALLSGSGDSDLYGPQFLLEDGVVLVTLNYRLETFGFLSTESKEAPGNAALKDQVAVLRWVQENISQFGGDPGNVTIFGESAGGICSTYHMVSPMSRGLFHKVIAQSGCVLSEIASSQKARERAFRVGKVLGKETEDAKELVDFLQSVPVKDLIRMSFATLTPDEKLRGVPVHFAPVVEKQYEEGQEVFLPKTAGELIKEGNFSHVPVLLGFNEKEGLISLRAALKKAEQFNVNFDRKVPRRVFDVVSKEKLIEIGLKMKKFYFGDKDMSKETALETAKLEGDYTFSIACISLANSLAKYSKAPVYLNRFAIDLEFNLMKERFGLSKFKGACHGDDLFYLFKADKTPVKGSETERAIKRMVRMWTNFAKHGNPTPDGDDLLPVKWEPVTEDKLNYMDIKSDREELCVNPDKERFDFWMNMLKEAEEERKASGKAYKEQQHYGIL